MAILARAYAVLIVSLGLVLLVTYQQWRSYETLDALLLAQPLPKDQALAKAANDLVSATGRLAHTWGERTSYLVVGLAAVGIIGILLTVFLRRKAGSGVMDYAGCALLCAAVVGVAQTQRVATAIVALAVAAAMLAVVIRRFRTKSV